MFKYKKTILLLGILALFIITNPSLKSFKDHIGNKSDANLRQSSNFFLFSIYKANDIAYLGLLNNFFRTTPKQVIKIVTPLQDTDKSIGGIDLLGKQIPDIDMTDSSVKAEHNKPINEALNDFIKTKKAKILKSKNTTMQ